MKRSEKEITDKEEIKKILKNANTLRIALCKKEKPYLVPLSFSFQKNTIYLHSSKEGKKIDIIKDRLINNYNYCDICATDVLNFVASIFARGDIKGGE